MKKLMFLALAIGFTGNVFAEGNQVFYRYGQSQLDGPRQGEIFTDVKGATGKNDGKKGKNFSAGVDLKMFNCPLFPSNSLLGEIMLDYNRFKDQYVTNAIGTVAGTSPSKGNVPITELAVVVAPKYRFDGIMDGKLRPWIIPIGMAFMVNSPPSDYTSYLDIGYHYGAGVEYKIVDMASVGVDYRRTQGSGDPGIAIKYSSFGAYLGFNF
ncbi:MAG: hypothetical protein ACOYL6_08755 [Bacteriovoracaceae bacterium]